MSSNFSKQFHLNIIEMLLEISKNSPKVIQKISLNEINSYNEMIKNLSYIDAFNILFNKNISESTLRKHESGLKTALKYGSAAIAGSLSGVKGGALTGMGILFLYRKLSDPCFKKCSTEIKKHKLCSLECEAVAMQNLIRNIRQEYYKCKDTDQPLECEKKLNKEFVKWGAKFRELTIQIQKEKIRLS